MPTATGLQTGDAVSFKFANNVLARTSGEISFSDEPISITDTGSAFEKSVSGRKSWQVQVGGNLVSSGSPITSCPSVSFNAWGTLARVKSLSLSLMLGMVEAQDCATSLWKAVLPGKISGSVDLVFNFLEPEGGNDTDGTQQGIVETGLSDSGDTINIIIGTATIAGNVVCTSWKKSAPDNDIVSVSATFKFINDITVTSSFSTAFESILDALTGRTAVVVRTESNPTGGQYTTGSAFISDVVLSTSTNTPATFSATAVGTGALTIDTP